MNLDNAARLTAHPSNGADYRAHVATYGPLPAVSADAVVRTVTDAGLRGRGGAWFPTGLKLQAVRHNAKVRHRRAIVVCNGMEGEPCSSGDEWILRSHPHLTLDGIDVAARTVGARKSYIAVHEGSASAAALHAALAQRPSGEGEVEIVEAPARYVASEETALSHFISGGPALPVFGQRPYEHGVRGRPTLVNNAETLAHLALIARHGAAWFREVGSPDAPGTTLVSVGGDVARTDIVEVAVGTPISSIIDAVGGMRGTPTAFQVAGFGGAWGAAELLAAPWDPDALRSQGLTAGAGILWAMTDRYCGVVETARTLDYLAGESAGQCGACTFGLSATATDFAALAACQADAEAVQRLQNRLASIPRRGGCALPDGAVRMAQSSLSVFANEVNNHLRGTCSAADPYPTEAWAPVPVAAQHPVVASGRHFT